MEKVQHLDKLMTKSNKMLQVWLTILLCLLLFSRVQERVSVKTIV